MKLLLGFMMSMSILGCPNKQYVKPLNLYTEESSYPIIFGSITGIPTEYTVSLYLSFKDKKGSTKTTIRPIRNPRTNEDPSIKRFSFFLPYADWTVTGLEIFGVKDYIEKGLILYNEKKLFIHYKMQDSLNIRFKTTRKGFHYLGRWNISGLENIDSLASPEIKKFKSLDKKQDIYSDHIGKISITIDNVEEEDLKYFNSKNRLYSKNSSIVTLPEILFMPDTCSFKMIIGDVNNSTYVPQNNWLHREFMKPNIPKY